MKNSNFNYILPKHLLKCGICGKSYFESESDKNNEYICLSTGCKMDCGNAGISINKIENLIQEVVFYFLEEKLLDVLTDKDITNRLTSKTISKIITKIIITKQNTFHHYFNEFKDDVVLEVKIIFDNQELKFNISQRTNYIYFYLTEFNLWFKMNNFFSGHWPKRGFNFIMGK